MRRFAMLLGAAFIAACTSAETGGSDQNAAGTVDMPMISLADVAGSWSLRAMPEMSDSVLIAYELLATADTSGWMLTFPDMDPIPVRLLAVDGDSIVGEAGPYPSLMRDSVQVTTSTVMRLVDGMLMGTFTARYATAGADSVLRGRLAGSRKQM